MGTVRKREWTNRTGQQSGWVVNYTDAGGKRRLKTFSRKKDAEAYLAQTEQEVRNGVHMPDTLSISVERAAALWLDRAGRDGLEPTTIAAYKQHVQLHILPFLGAQKITRLTRPRIEAFRDELLAAGRSQAMAQRVLRSLKGIINEAERLGYVAQNVARGVTIKRSARKKRAVVPPTKEHMRRLLQAAEELRPSDHPMLLLLLFAGLRASELRALAWSNVDLKAGLVRVDRRADAHNVIGEPKTAAGRRSIPVPPSVVNALKKWKLQCPPSNLDLVFPSATGTPIFYSNLVSQFQEPLLATAGLLRRRADGRGEEGIYSFHDFRHAAASLWIEQRVQPKLVQTWMGHSSITVTFDTYGHLFAAMDNHASVVAAVERELLGDAGATQLRQTA